MFASLRLLQGLAGLCLLVGTWPLWWPGTTRFPVVPFFSWLTSANPAIDRVLTVLVLGALSGRVIMAALELLGVGRLSSWVRKSPVWLFPVVFSAASVALILLNQHRLQVWLLHFLILTPVLTPVLAAASSSSTFESGDSARRAEDRAAGQLAVIAAAIYFWSAISKLDASFLQTHGPQFVDAICGRLGIATQFWTPSLRTVIASTLPLGELAIAVLLLVPRCRRTGLALSLVMHGLLLLAVGPWGLNHSVGVILWNVFLIGQNGLLLSRRRIVPRIVAAPAEVSSRETSRSTTARLATASVCLICLFPALRLTGHADNWPGWAVYVSNSPRLLIQIRDSASVRLPEELRPFVETRPLSDGWSWLRIDLWSVRATGSPLYPEARFQLAVALAVQDEYQLGDAIQLVEEGEADRWTAQRTVKLVTDLEALKRDCATNTRARRVISSTMK